MKHRISIWTGLTLAAAIAAAPIAAYAQSPAVRTLLERAHAQEQSDRTDLAAQTWQQLLLADPNNTEAIAGLARCARLAGNDAEAANYLDQLRRIDPGNANIAKIQNLASARVRDARLHQAAQLAQAGHPEDAFKIYQQTWPDGPPDGNWALAYYDTQASIPAQRTAAIAGLRDLAGKYPTDTRYTLTLARVLTYSLKTRAEGERILSEHAQDPAAQAALRQALVWDVQNPGAAPFIREYLRRHTDEELAADFAKAEVRQVAAAQAAAENAAFAALAANKVDLAQSLFAAINIQQPRNPRALAGLGFVSMKQGNFAAAINDFEQAQQNGLQDKAVDSGLLTSRFWNTVQQGAAALNANRFDEAEARYKSALDLRADSPEALDGLSGVYIKAGRPAQAIPIYQRMVKLNPASIQAWRGLLVAQTQASQNNEALATERSLPPAVRSDLAQDPEYLRNLAVACSATGNDTEAQQLLAQALALPFPESARKLKAAVRLQYAQLLAAGKRYEQAAGLYRDVLTADPANVSAWQGLVAVQHDAGHDAEAVSTIERMPAAARNTATQDTGFLSLAAAIYQQQNRFDVALGFLERAARLAADQGQALPVPLQLQLAAAHLQQGNTAQAFVIYRAVLIAHPDRSDAWKDLISGLHQSGSDQDALAQMSLIPAEVRRTLEQDPEYLQTLASIYASTGDRQSAVQTIEQMQARCRARNILPPAEVEIQSAWLLYNAGLDTGSGNADRDLARTLTALGSRADLKDAQRRRVQTIRASWTVRRAEQVADLGDTPRALQILTAAQKSFPGNLDVTRALAGIYLRAGQPKQVIAIYQSREMAPALAHPTASDYQGMIGAAIALHNLPQAQTWLHQALAVYPKDPQILASAARVAQARGNNTHAVAYWKASLAAMPQPPANPSGAAQLRLGVSSADSSSTHWNALTLSIPPPPATEQASLQQTLDSSTAAHAPSAAQSLLAEHDQQAIAGNQPQDLPSQDPPPVLGPWASKRLFQHRDPRQEAEMQLATIEGGYSPWLGGTGYVTHRSGTAGMDQLNIFEAPVEASTPLGGIARLTLVTTPSFLDSGALDGASANRLGTLPVGATASRQNASGVGGEVQLSTSRFGAGVGYTPYEFPVSNIIGRFSWRPAGGPFTVTFNRDAVGDSQLSYAGLRDPGSATPAFSGNSWGGVVADAANLQFSEGDAKSGLYLGTGGQYLTGQHVETNHRIDGVAGAYWHILALPRAGDLAIGANFFAMHYAENLRYFTYGQGGYFSPSAYFLANAPVTWTGHYGVNLHYAISGAFGLQDFHEDSSAFFPINPSLQASNKNQIYPADSVLGSNYDLHGEVAYHLSDHWYMGGFVALNNTRDYASQSAGFFIRFLGRPQYPTEQGPTGLFPYQGNRPLIVP